MQVRFTLLVLFASMVRCLTQGAGNKGLLVSSRQGDGRAPEVAS